MKIGIDLGGTKIEGIAISDNGEELLRKRIMTPKGDYDGTVNSIFEIVGYLESYTNEKGSVGVGIPGAVSPKTGMIKNANSTCLIGRNFNKDLEIRLKREVRLANDANCLAVSEAVDGSGADSKVVLAIIIGTGCGAGIALEKRVHNGPNYIAGEWGHISLGWMNKEEYPGPNCYCGQRGCNETFISGTGFENEYKKQTGKIKTGYEIVNLLENGDSFAEKVMEIYESRLARAIASVVNIVDPEVIVLGGGMSNISRLYETIPDLVCKWTFGKEFSTPIRKAMHGDSSGVRGAAWLW